MSSQIGSLIERRQPALPLLGTPTSGYPSFPRPELRLLGFFPIVRQTPAREPWSALVQGAIGASSYLEEARPASGGLVSDERQILQRMSRVAVTGPASTWTLGLGSRQMSTSELVSERSKALVAHGAPAAGQTGILPTAAVIWSLVQRQRLGAARQLLSSLPDTPEYRKLRALLRPPRTWTAPSRDRDRSADFRWLHQHGRDYVGRWVAVADGCLLAEADSLRALRRQLRQSAPQGRPLIHFIR